MAGRPISLQARQLLAASLGLIAFLGLTGYALDRAFTETSKNALRDRLRSYALAYVSGMEFSRDQQPLLPELPPDPRFDRPGSGLYAGLLGANGKQEAIEWQSASGLGRELPFADRLDTGAEGFGGPLASPAGNVYRYSYGFRWEDDSGDLVAAFTFFVAEDEYWVRRQIDVFRRALWVYLGGGAMLLLGLQVLVLRWSLQPLRRVSTDMRRVESGQRPELDGAYPRELALLTDNINAFVKSEREHLDRYRNTLSDLAHSLKTPLAVLRTRIDADHGDDASLREEVLTQVRRMDEIVAYQLSRAATTGHQLFSAPLKLAEPAENIVQSLEKVYAAKNVLCEFEIDQLARFYGEQGDLMELLGNLLENAFKWCHHRVVLTARAMTVAPNRRSGLLLTVEDDGPGIAEDQIARVLQRGVRGDERVHGHGIGLAIVQDIVRAYHGELAVERSEELGGARFVVQFAPLI